MVAELNDKAVFYFISFIFVIFFFACSNFRFSLLIFAVRTAPGLYVYHFPSINNSYSYSETAVNLQEDNHTEKTARLVPLPTRPISEKFESAQLRITGFSSFCSVGLQNRTKSNCSVRALVLSNQATISMLAHSAVKLEMGETFAD